jgi:zinc D-Ala-D-Ala carboxypeptidase
MLSTTIKKYQRILNTHGFPCGKVDGKIGPSTHAATLRFQEAWAGGSYGGALLRRNGKLNRSTRKALRYVARNGKLSKHFTTRECMCKHGGTYACGKAYVRRELLLVAEKYRAKAGAFVPISVYRCPTHNENVGGATESMHTYGGEGKSAGLAMDVPPRLTVSQVRAIGGITGIGYNSSSGKVAHIDVRGILGRPSATWVYAR